MIDMDLLKAKNIIALKYIKNRNFVPSFPKQIVSQKVADLITEYCETETFNKITFSKLNTCEQRVVFDFVNACHVDVGIDSVQNKNELQEQFEILTGEIAAGNNSVDIKKRLKTVIKQAIMNNQISAKQGLMILEDL